MFSYPGYHQARENMLITTSSVHSLATVAPMSLTVNERLEGDPGCRRVLVRLCHRQLVFCPRYEAYEELVGSSTEGPCSFPVAVEGSTSAERSGGLTEPRGSDQSSTAGGQLEHADRASMTDEAAEEGSTLVAPSGTHDGQRRNADGDRAMNEAAGEDTPLLAQSSSSPDQVSLQAGALLARSHQQQIAVPAGEEQAVQGGFFRSSAPREQQDSSTASAPQPQQTSGQQRAGAQLTPFYSAAAAASAVSSTAAVDSSASTATSPVQDTSAPRSSTAADAVLPSRRMSSCLSTETVSPEQQEDAGTGSGITADTRGRPMALLPKPQVRQRLSPPWDGLLPFLQGRDLPVLDRAFAQVAPACALQQPSEQDSIVHKLLLCKKAGLFDVSVPNCLGMLLMPSHVASLHAAAAPTVGGSRNRLYPVLCHLFLQSPVEFECAQAQSMGSAQREFLFEYLCKHVPQTGSFKERDFVRQLPILPTFMDGRRRAAEDCLLCSQELLTTVVGDLAMLPETLLVRASCCNSPSHTPAQSDAPPLH